MNGHSTVEKLEPAALRGFFERKVPLEAADDLLTNFAFLTARMHEVR